MNPERDSRRRLDGGDQPASTGQSRPESAGGGVAGAGAEESAEVPASPAPERGSEEKVARLEELRRQVEACTDLEQAIELLTQVEAAAKELLEAVDQEKRAADARG